MPKGIDKKWSEEETVVKVIKKMSKMLFIIFLFLEKIRKRIKTIWKKFS